MALQLHGLLSTRELGMKLDIQLGCYHLSCAAFRHDSLSLSEILSAVWGQEETVATNT